MRSKSSFLGFLSRSPDTGAVQLERPGKVCAIGQSWGRTATLHWKQHLLAQSGNGGMRHMPLLSDKQLISTYPAFPVVTQLGQANALSDSMRPAVPRWADLAELMGTVFHDMLSGNLTPEAATAMAQTRALQLFASARP